MKAVGQVRIHEIKEYFQYRQISGNDESLERWVIVPDVNRPGLELAGYYKYTEPRRIVIIGEKESSYIETLPEQIQRDRFDKITDGYTPCIIIAHDQPCPPLLLEIAQYRNFPIFTTEVPTYRVMTDLVTFLDAKMAPTDTVHGVLITVYGIGVLLMGESGMGKSEIALELIRKGHILVADDRVDISRVHNTLVGKAPELLEGMLEIRGIGVIDVARMFGGSSLLEEDHIELVIKLEKYDSNTEYARVGNEEEKTMNILNLEVPMIVLPVKEGRSMAVLIESAVTNFQLKKRGFNSAKIFEDKVYNYIEKQNDEKKNTEKEDGENRKKDEA